MKELIAQGPIDVTVSQSTPFKNIRAYVSIND